MIEIIQGDITKLQVDVVVNAANGSLLGGGGVDGAIHRAAGPELLIECEKLKGCPTGQVRMTRGYDLPAPFIIHAVGPVYSQHSQARAITLLASCYIESLKRAALLELDSVAFPCISTGVYGFPQVLAAEVALKAVRAFQARFPKPSRVILCAFDTVNLDALRAAWLKLGLDKDG